MTLAEFRQILAAHPNHTLRWSLPNGQIVPAHAHVTEVARVDKHFVDCGGTRRDDSVCRLQVWVATDVEHRLAAKKLHRILAVAAPLLPSDAVPVDVEYEAGFISQFPIETFTASSGELVFQLGVRHTACLAEDKCGIPQVNPPILQGINFKPRAASSIS